MTDFTAKNERRRQGRNSARDLKARKKARAQRKMLGGAFGNLGASSYNSCAYGTTAQMRDEVAEVQAAKDALEAALAKERKKQKKADKAHALSLRPLE